MTQPRPDISIVKKNWDSISGIQRFSHEAMATTFEVLILNEDTHYAHQAAGAAFDELDRIEAELSRFIENSDISRINNLAAEQSLQVGLFAFECLQLCARIHLETNKAFDIAIGTGIHLLKLDQAGHTVSRLRASGSAKAVQIDLGGIGKGYAVDRMAKLLRDWSIDTALIHSGGSSVLALGAPSGTKGWPLTLSNPRNRKQTLACLCLQNRALSGSGLQKGLHIIDPRTAQPVMGKCAAWACAHTATTADALSTAFMVMTPDEVKQYCLLHPDILAMVILEERDTKAQKDKILHFGPWEKDKLIK